MHFYTVKMQVVPMLNDHVGNKKPSENFLACRFIGTTQNVVCIFVILHLDIDTACLVNGIYFDNITLSASSSGDSDGSFSWFQCFNAKILMG